MDQHFSDRVEASLAEALVENAAQAGRSLEDRVADVRQRVRPLSVAEKLKLSARLRAMTAGEGSSGDSTEIIRRYRDSQGGRWADDGGSDDAGR